MFLRQNRRRKNGKEHRYYSVVENRRLQSGRVVAAAGAVPGRDQRQPAGGLAQDAGRVRRTATACEDAAVCFPEDRPAPADAVDAIQVKLSEMQLRRPRPFGDCWLGCELWRQLELDRFWERKLPRRARRDGLAAGAGIAGGEPADRSGQRVPCASAMVRSKRHGRCCWGWTSRWRRRTGCTAVWTGCWSTRQELFLHLQQRWKDSVRCGVRCAAVRPDQHVFRRARPNRIRRPSAATAATGGRTASRW